MRLLRANPGAMIPAGSTKILSRAVDNGKVLNLDTITGSIVTLPPSAGDNFAIICRVGVLATSNSHIIKVANAVDVMRGVMFGFRADSGNAVLGFAAGATDDTITLNRTTTGSVSLGEWIELVDVALGIWQVRGFLSATGAAFATPFSATVS